MEAHFDRRSISLHTSIEANIFLELNIRNRNRALGNIGPLLRIQRIYTLYPFEFPSHDDLAVIDAAVAGLASESKRAGLADYDVRTDIALQAQLILIGVLLDYEDRL